ncbi:glycerate kinase type-2 family protein [Hyperthermus butylicus]|uniref:Glycerate kinase (GckA) n=1 Tax=Hyperthermus butylicus (strain DSM 5456 / JCM 9403 / PLM1-5) TaxID=415426 RepID=A2BJE1_HYPBU|nr:DUF4147 domain-containing protein [Hyperthermus butylicus]ABM80102.1 putative glycerate kinase (GckA) [Hyperthermus butylicus DSM 5456]
MGRFIRNRGVLERSWLHGVVLDSLEAALEHVHPSSVIPRWVTRFDSGCVKVRGAGGFCPGAVYVAGFGKAAPSMARALINVLGADFVEAGMVIGPPGGGGRIGPIEVLEGDHPIPGSRTLEASRRLLDFLRELPRDSLLFLLVSGGGSALFEVPAAGVELEDVAVATKLLMAAGADIYELNTVRKHLSAVKGGQLLRYIAAERVVSLILSDVPGDDPSLVASGPTVPDPSTFRDALRVLSRYGLLDRIPVRARRRLEAGAAGAARETLKPGDPLASKAINIIVARNLDALTAAAALLESHGVAAVVLTDTLRGEAREAGRVLASLAEAAARGLPAYPRRARLVAVIAGGETTVTVRGRGVGGRNQELCLSLALEASKLRILERYVAACIGTDGVDGASPAAGAIVDEQLPRELEEKQLDPKAYLDNNDTYTLFSRLARTVDTGGYTGTNVNDVTVVVVERQEA